jgi:hypothetical protein
VWESDLPAFASADSCHVQLQRHGRLRSGSEGLAVTAEVHRHLQQTGTGAAVRKRDGEWRGESSVVTFEHPLRLLVADSPTLHMQHRGSILQFGQMRDALILREVSVLVNSTCIIS